MSRCSDDFEPEYPNAQELWTANLKRLIAGKNGQRWLREIEAALLALPKPRLIEGALCREGEVCLVGAVAAHRLRQGHELKGPGYTGTSVASRMARTVRTLDDLEAATHTIDSDYETAEFAAASLGMAKTLAYELVWQNDEAVSPDDTPENRYEHALRWVRSQMAVPA